MATRTRCRWVDNVDTAPVAEQGPQIEHHPRFPQRVNAGFMQVVDRANIKLRVFERRRRRNAGLRHGRLRGGGGGHRLGLLEHRVDVPDARRHSHDRVARRGSAGVLMTGPAHHGF